MTAFQTGSVSTQLGGSGGSSVAIIGNARSISDPLQLLPYQTGLIEPPLVEGPAKGGTRLDAQQRAIELGEPVPIVFCRRVDGVGGVFVSPGATEGRFENDGTTNELTVNWELVLSEGELPALELRDVFQRACRVGTWAQTYDRRAGTWTPGNFITVVAGTTYWNCPVYCGTSGEYTNLTTLSYENTHADADDTWDKQVHAFVREGMQVERIIDSVTGSSNNVVDLALYLIRQSSRFPEDMLDLTAMLAAAEFTDTNELYYNGEFKESTNLEDWLQQISRNFLLRISDKNGKKGFRPLLPTNVDHTIKITAIDWVFAFTEEHLLPDGFQIEYIPLSERKPICAQVLWRQQPDNDIGLIRTSEVRFTGEATNGPFEQYDLSQFCTSEDHAVKVGTYIIAKRKYITHTLRIKVKPDAYNSTLELGDIVRVQLRRETDALTTSFHDYLYEVERINKSISGIVEMDLIHFPIDTEGRSLIARQVAQAVGVGYELPTGREDFTCDIPGRDEDTDPLPDQGGNLPDLPDPGDFDYELPDLGGEGPPPDGNDNPEDPFDQPAGPVISGESSPPIPGDDLTVNNICNAGQTNWYRVYPNGDIQQVGFNTASYEIKLDQGNSTIYAETCCPDPSTPSGFGICLRSEDTAPIDSTYENPGDGTYRVRCFVSPGTETTYQFTLLSGPTWMSGFSLRFSDIGCSFQYNKVVISYYNTTGNFISYDWTGCTFTGINPTFLANLDKNINGTWVFQKAIYKS